MTQGSIIAGSAIVLLAIAWFIVKALVGHLAATLLGKRIAKWRRDRRNK
jgi:ABC-type spermidine/putrescine transport system permease subunit I